MSSNTYQRGRKHSPESPRNRRRSRTRSMDSYYSYSDSFDSDDDKDNRNGRTRKTQSTKPRNKIGASYRPQQKKKPGKPKGQIDLRNIDPVAQRMLSARRLKIDELKNENVELRHILDEVKDEARTLKQTQRKQEKALQKFDSQEGELTSLITRHNEEVRFLKDQVRKYRSKMEQSKKQYRDMSDEFYRMKAESKKMRDLVEQKELREREELDRKLNNAEVELDQKDRRIRELERHIENLHKNHKHELAIEVHRHKDTKAQLDNLLQQNSNLERELSAKTKVMDVANIYSNRGRNVRAISPASGRKPMPSDLESLATPRDKIERQKMYEQRRREKAKKRAEAKQRLENRKVEPEVEKSKELSRSDSPEAPKWEYERSDNLKFSFKSDPRTSKSYDENGFDDDDEFFETKKRVESPVIPETYEPTYEDKPLPRRDTFKAPSPPPRSPTPPPREPTPPPRSPTPPPREPTPPPKSPTPPPPKDPTPPPLQETEEEIEQRRKKELLLARLRALDDEKLDEKNDEDINQSNKPRYSFSKPVDNLHHGLPSHEDVKVPYLERQKRRQSLNSDSVTSTNSKKTLNEEDGKKKDLMSALFGDAVEKNDNNEKTRKTSYDMTSIGYTPSTGPARPAARHQLISKPVVNAVDDHVHEDEIEEFIL